MTDEELIDLYRLLFGFFAYHPSKSVGLALGSVYGELKEKGYEIKEVKTIE